MRNIKEPADRGNLPRRETKAPIAKDNRSLRNTLLIPISVASTVFVLQYAEAFLIPCVLAILVFYALDPIVSILCRLRVPRGVAATLVIAALIGGMFFAAYSLRSQAVEVLDRLPEAVQKAQQAIRAQRNGGDGSLDRVQEVTGEIEKAVADAAGQPETPRGVTRVQIEEPLFRASDYLWSGSANILWLGAQAVTILFLVFFLLATGDLFKRKLVSVVGPGLERKKVTVQILNEIDQQIRRYILIQILTSVIIGSAMAGALWLLGVGQPLVWGAFAGVLNTIPYFGSIVVTGGLTLVAFLQFGTLSMALTVGAVTLGVTSMDSFLITPALTSRASQMNNVVIFVSLLFWGWLWGAMGVLLAVPIMMVIKSVCDRVEGLQPIAHILSDAR